MAPQTAKRAGHHGHPLRLCTEPHCARPHFDNCPLCYGFGVHAEPAVCGNRSLHLPIMGTQIGDPPPWMPCPNCGGSPLGLPQ